MPMQSVPEFLSDLIFTIGGKTLQLFPVPNKDNLWHFGIDPDKHKKYGVFANFESEYAEIRDNYSVKFYRSGTVRWHTCFDQETPDANEAPPFKEWLRNEVLKDISRLIMWHLSDVFTQHPIADNIELYKNICGEFTNLPKFEFQHHNHSGMVFDVLSTIHRNIINKTLPSDQLIFPRFIESIQEDTPSNQSLSTIVQLILNLMPTIPDCVRTYYANKMMQEYGYNDLKPLTVERLQYLSKFIKKLTPVERSFHHNILLRRCTTSGLCHVMAAAVFDHPKESEPYIQKGLSCTPDDISLLVIAETFYLNHPNAKQLQQIRKRIQKMGVKSNGNDQIQIWINRYTHLCNDYQYFNPSTDTTTTAAELLELESKLNLHWLMMVPEQSSLSRPLVEEQLIEQRRFLSAGSAGICGWLRNQKRYQDVVDYMMPLCNQLELCTLRHKTYPKGFELFLNNGLSCFLDSQNEKHIKQAIQIIDALETIIPEWSTGEALYTFACITSRSNDLERCMDYILHALDKNESINEMAKDSDFQNVRNHPRFLELVALST